MAHVHRRSPVPLRPQDFVSGRHGNKVNNREGNRALRAFLEPYKEMYRALEGTSQTVEFTWNLLMRWKADDHKFLEKDSEDPDTYYEVDDNRAREAIRRKLMEKTTAKALKRKPEICPPSPPPERKVSRTNSATRVTPPEQERKLVDLNGDVPHLPFLDHFENEQKPSRLTTQIVKPDGRQEDASDQLDAPNSSTHLIQTKFRREQFRSQCPESTVRLFQALELEPVPLLSPDELKHIDW